MITTVQTTQQEFATRFRDVVSLWLESDDSCCNLTIDGVDLALAYRDQRAGPYCVLNDQGRVVGFNDSPRDFLSIGDFVYQYVKEAAE